MTERFLAKYGVNANVEFSWGADAIIDVMKPVVAARHQAQSDARGALARARPAPSLTATPSTTAGNNPSSIAC